LDEQDLLEITRIIVDSDEEAALKFLKKAVYDRLTRTQQESMKSFLDTGGNLTDWLRRTP
jgi:hypothetical protein